MVSCSHRQNESMNTSFLCSRPILITFHIIKAEISNPGQLKCMDRYKDINNSQSPIFTLQEIFLLKFSAAVAIRASAASSSSPNFLLVHLPLLISLPVLIHLCVCVCVCVHSDCASLCLLASNSDTSQTHCIINTHTLSICRTVADTA